MRFSDLRIGDLFRSESNGKVYRKVKQFTERLPGTLCRLRYNAECLDGEHLVQFPPDTLVQLVKVQLPQLAIAG